MNDTGVGALSSIVPGRVERSAASAESHAALVLQSSRPSTSVVENAAVAHHVAVSEARGLASSMTPASPAVPKIENSLKLSVAADISAPPTSASEEISNPVGDAPASSVLAAATPAAGANVKSESQVVCHFAPTAAEADAEAAAEAHAVEASAAAMAAAGGPINADGQGIASGARSRSDSREPVAVEHHEHHVHELDHEHTHEHTTLEHTCHEHLHHDHDEGHHFHDLHHTHLEDDGAVEEHLNLPALQTGVTESAPALGLPTVTPSRSPPLPTRSTALAPAASTTDVCAPETPQETALTSTKHAEPSMPAPLLPPAVDSSAAVAVSTSALASGPVPTSAKPVSHPTRAPVAAVQPVPSPVPASVPLRVTAPATVPAAAVSPIVPAGPPPPSSACRAAAAPAPASAHVPASASVPRPVPPPAAMSTRPSDGALTAAPAAAVVSACVPSAAPAPVPVSALEAALVPTAAHVSVASPLPVSMSVPASMSVSASMSVPASTPAPAPARAPASASGNVPAPTTATAPSRFPAKRYHATPEQLSELMAMFEKTQSPSAETLRELSERTTMPLANLVLWFKNRRARATKKLDARGNVQTVSNIEPSGRRSYVKSGIYSKKKGRQRANPTSTPARPRSQVRADPQPEIAQHGVQSPSLAVGQAPAISAEARVQSLAHAHAAAQARAQACAEAQAASHVHSRAQSQDLAHPNVEAQVHVAHEHADSHASDGLPVADTARHVPHDRMVHDLTDHHITVLDSGETVHEDEHHHPDCDQSHSHSHHSHSHDHSHDHSHAHIIAHHHHHHHDHHDDAEAPGLVAHDIPTSCGHAEGGFAASSTYNQEGSHEGGVSVIGQVPSKALLGQKRVAPEECSGVCGGESQRGAEQAAPVGEEPPSPKRVRQEYTEHVGDGNPCSRWDSDTCMARFSTFLAASSNSRVSEQLDNTRLAASKFFLEEMQSGLTLTSPFTSLEQSLADLEVAMDSVASATGVKLKSGPRVILREFVAQIRSGRAASIPA